MSTSRLRRRVDERGAVAIFMALVIGFVVVPLAGLAVDIGIQRIARVDAQAIADTSAQDAARALGTGTTSQSALEAIALASAKTNAEYVGKAAPTVKLFTGTLSTTFVSDQSLGCGASHFNSYFTQTPVGSTPDAVLAVVRNAVDFNLVPGSGSVCRSAIARAYKTACMTMDSYAAALKTADSAVLGPLNKILGTSIDASVLSGSGILTTDLDVLSFLNILKTQLGVGSIDQVLTTQVSAAQLLQAEATALTQKGSTATAALGALNSQITSRVGGIVSPSGFTVGTLLGLSQGGAAALGTTVNAFDLAAAAVQLANGTHPVAVGITLPAGLTGATSVGATIGSRPTRVCLGEGTKTMGQTSVTATANISSPGSLVNNLVTSLTGVVNAVLCGTVGAVLGADCYGVPTVSLGTVTATVSLASASGEVLSLNCTGATPGSLNVREAASLAPFSITIPLIISETRTYGSVLNRRTETVTSTFTITATTDAASSSVAATLNVPSDYDTGKAGPSGNLSVPTLQIGSSLTSDGKFTNASGSSLVGNTLGGLNGVVNLISGQLLTPLLSTVVSPLVTVLTTALKNAVGLTVAGSTYTPLRTPSCGTPALVG